MNLKIPFLNALNFALVGGILVFFLKKLGSEITELATQQGYAGEMLSLFPEGNEIILLVTVVAFVVGFVIGLVVELIGSLFEKGVNKVKEQ